MLVMEKTDFIMASFNTLSYIKTLILHSVTLMPRDLILELNGCDQPELSKCLFNHSYFCQLEENIATIYDRVNTCK